MSSEPDDLDPHDPLATAEDLRAWLSDRPWMADRVVPSDLAPLSELRRELRAVFDAAVEGRSPDVVARLNEALDRHRARPSVSGHDDDDWHLHVASAQAPVAEEYAAGAAMGLTMAFLDLGRARLGACADPRCRGGLPGHVPQPLPPLLLGPVRQPGQRRRPPAPPAERAVTPAP